MFPIEIFNIIASYEFGALIGLTQISRRFNTYFDSRLKHIKYRLIYNMTITNYGRLIDDGITFVKPGDDLVYSVTHFATSYQNRYMHIVINKTTIINKNRVKVLDNGKTYEYIM